MESAMASSISSNPPSYTCITVLAGYFAAIHVDGNTKKFISKHPTDDYSVAFAAAKAFADLARIPFQKGLKLMDKPLITVLKTDRGWLPGMITADKVSSLLPNPSASFSGSKEDAMAAAQGIAQRMNADFVPLIGASMTESEERKQP